MRVSKWKLAAGVAAIVAVVAIAAGLFFLSPSNRAPNRAKAAAEQFLAQMKYGQLIEMQTSGTASLQVITELQAKPLPDVRDFKVTYVQYAAFDDTFLVGADLQFALGRPVPHVLLIGKTGSGKWEVQSMLDAERYGKLQK